MEEIGEITIELLPHERRALLKWDCTPEVRSQLKSFGPSDDIETITVEPYVVGWLLSDLTRAILDHDCRDQDVIDLCDRLEYIKETGDGLLDIDDW